MWYRVWFKKKKEYSFKVRDFISVTQTWKQSSIGKYPLFIPRLQNWGIFGAEGKGTLLENIFPPKVRQHF